MRMILTSLMTLAVMSTPSLAADAEKGAKVYRKCVSCHMIGDKAKNRVGPQLNAIIGRKIASVADYRYSKAMTAYGEANKVWSEDILAAYLANPRKTVKGTRMAFAGLRKEKDVADVITYLKQATK
jgi:cytochrome c